MNDAPMHNGDDAVMKSIRKEKLVALGIFIVALTIGLVVIVIQGMLIGSSDRSAAIVPGAVVTVIFTLLAIFHYVTAAWMPERELRRKADK